ncbi:MAG: site-specific integrase [Segetibacter sp.]
MVGIVEELISIAIRKKIVDRLAFVKRTFKSDLDIKNLNEQESIVNNQNPYVNLDIFFQIDDYINSKKQKVCKDMPRIYRNMKEHLKAFETFRNQAITFDCLNHDFYEDFVEFLSGHYIQKHLKDPVVGLKINTVGKTIKQFRTFIRNRIRKKIIPSVDLEGWNILEEEVDAVYCNWKEVNLIYNADLKDYPHLEEYRNDFVVACLTGLRFSDFSKLEEHDLRDDMLYKKQKKSNHWVVIPLRPEAKEILENRFCKNLKPLTNAEFNRHIKTIAKLAGITNLIKHSYKKSNNVVEEIKCKYEWITSHTCRRSFCTNEFLAGTPVELIMKISGHKSVKDFYKYIRISPEEAGHKIRMIWQQRGESSVLKKASQKILQTNTINL